MKSARCKNSLFVAGYRLRPLPEKQLKAYSYINYEWNTSRFKQCIGSKNVQHHKSCHRLGVGVSSSTRLLLVDIGLELECLPPLGYCLLTLVCSKSAQTYSTLVGLHVGALEKGSLRRQNLTFFSQVLQSEMVSIHLRNKTYHHTLTAPPHYRVKYKLVQFGKEQSHLQLTFL